MEGYGALVLPFSGQEGLTGCCVGFAGLPSGGIVGLPCTAQ